MAPLPQIKKYPTGYSDPKRVNITDEILANCATVDEAIQFLENKKIALKNAHIFFGDRTGNAKIVEWVDGRRQIVEINNNRLIATNFNLSDTANHDTKCWRYPIIQKGLEELDAKEAVDLKAVGNVMAKAVQPPQKDSSGKVGGTLYTSFIDITDMKMILVYKLDNFKIYRYDIIPELQSGKIRKIKFE
jgi:predicted choloylglycine hydrolase